MLRPWMAAESGVVICLMCPCGRCDRKGNEYYQGIKPGKAGRRRFAKWLKHHRRCGFSGLH